jgi:vacuolar-type H+-ATPase subunit E/Vma4
MNLEPLRRALQGQAATEARRRRAEVEQECERLHAEAEAQARSLGEEARLEGELAAAREAGRRRAAAHRRARELELQAQRSLLDQLRLRSQEAALGLRSDPRYAELLDRLASSARSQLGPEARVEIDPPSAGGLTARAGSRSVDYSLRVLVDRAIEELDGEVEALWR